MDGVQGSRSVLRCVIFVEGCATLREVRVTAGGSTGLCGGVYEYAGHYLTKSWGRDQQGDDPLVKSVRR